MENDHYSIELMLREKKEKIITVNVWNNSFGWLRKKINSLIMDYDEMKMKWKRMASKIQKETHTEKIQYVFFFANNQLISWLISIWSDLMFENCFFF